MKPFALNEVWDNFHNLNIISSFIGELNKTISRVSAAEKSQPGDLIFIDKPDYLKFVFENKPSAVILSEKLKDQVSDNPNTTFIFSPYVPLAHALIRQKFASRDYSESGWNQIHPSAIVHETALISNDVVIEPKAVIGARVQIGARSRIMAGVVVENDAVIGEDTIIHPNVVIGYKCKIGSRVQIESGTVIGSEGFGFAQDAKKRSYPIPQTGIVVIEDDVRIGANNCIDRAAFDITRIGRGTKLDNLCHVAHNVQIGEDCLLTAMLCVAGSTQIGDRVITSGQTGIIDHKTICSDTVFLHRAGVTKDIDEPGAYAGLPLQPLQEYMKNQAVLKNATELKKRIGYLEKILESLDSQKKNVT